MNRRTLCGLLRFGKIAKTGFLIVALLVVSGASCKKKDQGQTKQQLQTLTIWRASDDLNAFAGIVAAFAELAPGVQINYVHRPQWKDNPALYEEEALNALATGRGPDIWSIRNDWIPRHFLKAIPAPEGVLAGKTAANVDYVRGQFVPVAGAENIINKQVIGLPLSVDSLALYYNSNIFQAAQEEFMAKQKTNPNLSQEELALKKKLLTSAPQDWKQILELVKLLSVRSGNDLTRPAIALGTAQNIKNAPDILAALMLQNGTRIVASDLKSATFNLEQGGVGAPAYPGRDALKFYARFSNPSDPLYAWNNQLPDAEEAFAGGKLAMIIADSTLAPKLKKSNPTLQFGVAPLPQINVTEPTTLARYWTEIVTTNSLNPTLAWQFLAFATSPKGVKTYLANTKRPSALWTGEASGNVFQDQAAIATSFYKGSQPLEFDRIFKEMIEAVSTDKRPIEEAINSAAAKITTFLATQLPPTQQNQTNQ